jgi:hypothetical protein
MKLGMTKKQLCVVFFPIIVMLPLTVLCISIDFKHDVYESVILLAVLIQFGFAIFLFRRDKQLSLDCFLVAFIVLILLFIGTPHT